MMSWLRTAIVVARTRKDVVAAIEPMVESSRCRFHGIPDRIWLEPYMIGFMTMLITTLAERALTRIEQHEMCRIQAEAWQVITRINYDIGEDILILSEARDENFLQGCFDADRMALELPYGRRSQPFPIADPFDDEGPEAGRPMCWRETFETYVSNKT